MGALGDATVAAELGADHVARFVAGQEEGGDLARLSGNERDEIPTVGC